MLPLILASKSPRRQQLLRMLGIEFDVRPANIDETLDPRLRPSRLVMKLSAQKAHEIAESRPRNRVIAAADTIVVHRKQILGQPADKEEAKQMLRALSNSVHEVYTGVALLRTDSSGDVCDINQFYERTKVTFGSLTEGEIKAYADSGSPLDKAGGYGIQDDWGAVFVSGINGDYYNVVGLPIHQFYMHLKHFAPELISNRYLEDAHTD